MKYVTLDDAALLCTQIAWHAAVLREQEVSEIAAVAHLEQDMPTTDPDVLMEVVAMVYELPAGLVPHQVMLLVLGSAVIANLAKQKGIPVWPS